MNGYSHLGDVYFRLGMADSSGVRVIFVRHDSVPSLQEIL